MYIYKAKQKSLDNSITAVIIVIQYEYCSYFNHKQYILDIRVVIENSRQLH